MPKIEFNKTICGDLEPALAREWLETNGIGGFACGTLAGANTRRYHGLLTSALKAPGGRMVLLAKLEETLVIDGRRVDLSTNEYAGAIHPEGYRYLTSFSKDPFPTFVFEVEGVRLEKSVLMVQGSNTVQVEYRVVDCPANADLQLELRPLIAFRDYHSTMSENSGFDTGFEIEPGVVSVQPYLDLPRLYFAHTAGKIKKEGYWYKTFIYRMERERGLDFQEDLFNPFSLLFDISKWHNAVVIASTEVCDARDAGSVREREQKRRELVLAAAPCNDFFIDFLTAAADQFLVRRGGDWTIIAGYPWFTDWGRDTMISLPGLTLFTKREPVAKSILANFAHHVDMGMVPNRFLDSGEVGEFNTVDATLWFFEAARAYAEATQDYSFVLHELYPVLEEIINSHIKGTRYNIKMAENGLLSCGAPGVQLTWMDAKVGDWVVTPRSGKPVEVQALWYNALRIMEDFARRFGDEKQQKRYSTLSSLTLWTFNRVFWNEERNCLFDVVNCTADPSIRPNQIFAMSLHYTMLSLARARAVVETVERELLTPVGLRTLSPSDPNYQGRCRGDQATRDAAYHQGTVWPWLLGPYLSAYIRVHSGSTEVRLRARQLLQGLENHIVDACFGQISEIFDGDWPHEPCGCFAQAWSVGEILRVLCQDVLQLVPMSGNSEIPVHQNMANV